MSQEYNKLMTDLQRLLGTQDFQSEADLRKFMDSIVGQQISSSPNETLNPKEQAQDLVFSAYELPLVKQNRILKRLFNLTTIVC